jgi:hypothetical protein
MAQESGIETPTIDDLVRLDRKRKGKTLSNEDYSRKGLKDLDGGVWKTRIAEPKPAHGFLPLAWR